MHDLGGLTGGSEMFLFETSISSMTLWWKLKRWLFRACILYGIHIMGAWWRKPKLVGQLKILFSLENSSGFWTATKREGSDHDFPKREKRVTSSDNKVNPFGTFKLEVAKRGREKERKDKLSQITIGVRWIGNLVENLFVCCHSGRF